jgi:hypothetical protein
MRPSLKLADLLGSQRRLGARASFAAFYKAGLVAAPNAAIAHDYKWF